jgi:hypothetical protein
MKKTAAILILFLFALLVWNVFTFGDSVVSIGDEDFVGPLGAVLAVVFAGVGILCIGGLALGACVLALMISPLLLPLLVPLAIVWLLMARSRKQRIMQQPV